MANEENLKKGEPYRFKSGEEQKEIARKGGKASAESKRRRKTMQETAKMILDMQIPKNAKELKTKLQAMGVPEEDLTYQTAVMIGILNQAIKGNTSAAAFLRDTVGEDPDLKEKKREADAKLKLSREMFEYTKEKDAGENLEYEDLSDVEAEIYGKADEDGESS